MTTSHGFFIVDREAGGRSLLDRASEDIIGTPFNLLDELNDCDGLVAASGECPFTGGCSEYFRNNLSPCLRSFC